MPVTGSGRVEAGRRQVPRLPAVHSPGHGHRDGGAQGAGRCGQALHAALQRLKAAAPIDLIHDTEGELVVRVQRRPTAAEIEDRIRGQRVRVHVIARAAACSPQRWPASMARRSRSALPGRRKRPLQRARQRAPAGHHHADARAPSRIGLARRRTTLKRRWDDEGEAKMGRFMDTIEGFGHPNAWPHERAVWAWNIRCGPVRTQNIKQPDWSLCLYARAASRPGS